MAYGTVNAEQMTTQSGFTLGAGDSSSFKNRIINGAMVIDQRNSGASVTINGAGGFTYTLDRWNAYVSANGKFTIQQNAGSVTPPVGFTNYLGVTSSSAYTVGSAELFSVNQFIEGFNTADLGWGTANAKTVTLSFQVYSSLTGTFGGALLNSAQNRSYPFSYTISSANTWTTISVTIAGDTSGTWLTSNNIGIKIFFGLGVGSTLSGTAGAWTGTSNIFSVTGATSVVGTNGATFYITGVQLEVGSQATSFDYRDYGTELFLCYRYYQRQFPVRGVGVAVINGIGRTKSPLSVTMRTSPTATISGTLYAYDGTSSYTITAFGQLWMTPDLLEFDADFVTGSATVGKCISIYNQAAGNSGLLSSGGVIMSAEL